MATKVSTTTLSSLANETSFLSALNDNITNLADAIDLLISRDGTSPNTLTASIDMNSNRIVNLATPTATTDAVTRAYVDSAVSGVSGGQETHTHVMSQITDAGALATKATVDTAEIEDDAVTTAKVLDDNVTPPKIAGIDANGIAARTSASTFATRTITGTTDEIDVSDGDGVSGNPTIGISDNPVIPGTASIHIPTGTTAQQPGTPAEGMIRYNSQKNWIEAYDGSDWVVVGASDHQYAQFQYQQPQNTNGGTPTASAWTKYPLNTEVYDDIGLTLTSSQISLSAGKYHISAVVASYANQFQRLRFYDTTNTTVLTGHGVQRRDNGYQNVVTTEGRFTLSGTATVELQYYFTNGTASTGLGFAANEVDPEVYGELNLWKIN